MAKLSGRFIVVSITDSGAVARDVSSDVDSVEIPDEYGSVDVTGFSDGAENSIAGMPRLPITINGTFNPAAGTGLYTVLKGLLGSYTGRLVEIKIGQNATPAGGDPKFSGTFWLARMPVSATPTGKVTISGEFEVSGSTAPSWGTV
jgi:hypothetical protein